MNKKLHFKSLLLLAVMLFGASSAWAADYEKYSGAITEGDYIIAYTDGAMKALIASNRLQYIAISDDEILNKKISSPDASAVWTITAKGDYFTIYNANTRKYAASSGTKNQAALLDADTDDKALWTITGESTYEFVNKANAADKINANLRRNGTYGFACYATGTGGALTLYKKVIDASDTRTKTTMSISGNPTTVSVGDEVETPTATVTAGTTVLESVEVKWSSSDVGVASIDESTGEITILTEGTTTITATFEGDDTYKECEDSFDLTVTPASVAPTSYTTMEELQAAVAEMADAAKDNTVKPVDATISFNGIQVSHVNGSNAFITDGDKGALIYTKNHGLEVGQVLNGTINCQIQKYQAQTEITNFTTEGLTITNGEISALEKTPGDITAANQSLLVTLKEVVYDATKKVFTDGTNDITYYDKFKTNVTLEGGKVYNITGIVIVNFETVEVCPRTADDVEEVVTEKIEPTSVWKSNGEEVSAICIHKDESVTISFDTNSTASAAFESSNTEVATVDDNGSVTLTGTAGVATITATTEANNEYLPSSATLSILVAEAEPEDAVFDFSLFQDYGSGMAPTTANVYVEEERTWTAGNITMTTNGKVRWYIGKSGEETTYTLRLYGKDEPYSYMTVSAPTGYYITAIDGVVSALTPNTGSISNNKWLGMAQEVTFTFEKTTGNAAMNSLKVTYTEPSFTMTMDKDLVTYCANMALDFSESGITAYTATVDEPKGVVVLKEIASGKVPANRGVILVGEAGKEYTVNVLETADKLDSNNLYGVTEDTEVAYADEKNNKYNYILQDGVFKKAAAEGATLKAGKAYLTTKYDVTATGARELKIVFDGEATGIKAIETAADQTIYDLQGRKVAAPSKGLYIIKGKKMIVK